MKGQSKTLASALGNDEAGSWCSGKMQISSSGVRAGPSCGPAHCAPCQGLLTCVCKHTFLFDAFIPPSVYPSICLSHRTALITVYFSPLGLLFLLYFDFFIEKKTFHPIYLIMFLLPQLLPGPPLLHTHGHRIFVTGADWAGIASQLCSFKHLLCLVGTFFYFNVNFMISLSFF